MITHWEVRTVKKRSLRERYRRFRRLWSAASTGAELGYTGPAELAEFNPPANKYWLQERLEAAVEPDERRRAAHGYLLQTVRIAEEQAQETADTELQAEVDRARLWLAECDLVAVSRLQQAQRNGGGDVVDGRVDPDRRQRQQDSGRPAEPAPIELDE